MPTIVRAWEAALLMAFFFCNTAGAQEILRYSVVANGEKVGSLNAAVNGNAVDIDYAVRNNGRGPTIVERIETDSKGRILKWTATGESTFGSPIDEEYVWSAGKARWRSQADSGDVDAPAPGLYIGNDVSPWAVGLYVRALLGGEQRQIDVLPGGSLRLDDLGESQLGDGRAAMAVRVYAVSGVDLQPDFVMIDKKGRLAAQLGGGAVTVREGYEDQYGRLVALFETLTQERVEALQARLSHRFEGLVLYRNVRIFDPKTGGISDPAMLAVFDGDIASIDYRTPSAAAPKDATVIDGEGGVLVPGLYDMHSHSSPWGGLFYLAAGVTGARDQGHEPQSLLELIDKTEAGAMAGPRIVRNGFIEGRSDFSSRTAFIVDSLQQGLDAVRWYADRGYFQIKIYNSMNPEWVKPLADEARSLGLGVTGHVPAFMTPDQAILAGYDDIAHVNQLMLGWLLNEGEDTRTTLRLTGMTRAARLDLGSAKVKKTVKLMKERDVALDTTAIILERLMLSRAGEVQEGDAPYLDHMPIGYQRYRRRSFVNADTPEKDADYRQAFEKTLQVLKLLHDGGVQLLPGTDDGTGVSLHREIELYVKAGLSNAEALRLATIACAEYLDRDHSYGSIEKGKKADFFLIEGDPLEDIGAIRKARLVSRGAQVYFPSEIYEALAIKPFASPPPVNAR